MTDAPICKTCGTSCPAAFWIRAGCGNVRIVPDVMRLDVLITREALEAIMEMVDDGSEWLAREYDRDDAECDRKRRQLMIADEALGVLYDAIHEPPEAA